MHYLGFVLTKQIITNEDDLFEIIKEYDADYYFTQGQNAKFYEDYSRITLDDEQEKTFNYELKDIFDGFKIGGRWDGWLVNHAKQTLNICQIKDLSIENTKNHHLEMIKQHYCHALEELKQGKIQEQYLRSEFELPTNVPLPSLDEYLEQKRQTWNLTPYAFFQEDSLINHYDYCYVDEESWHEEFYTCLESIQNDHYIIVVDFHI